MAKFRKKHNENYLIDERSFLLGSSDWFKDLIFTIKVQYHFKKRLEDFTLLGLVLRYLVQRGLMRTISFIKRRKKWAGHWQGWVLR